MKACFRYFAVAAAFLMIVGCVHCSDRKADQREVYIDVPFEDYAEGRENLRVVLGCGQEHRILTCGGFEHDHDEAYTIDLRPSRIESRWEVFNPHRYGNAFDEETWRDIPGNSLDDIKAEHVVLFSFADIPAIQSFLQESSTPQEAKKKAEYVCFNWLVDRAAIHLKPGGILTILPAFHLHAWAPFCCKGIFQTLIKYAMSHPSNSFVTTGRSLLEVIHEDFPFERGFSHMTIHFYQVLEEDSSERMPSFVSDYILNMSFKAEEESEYKNAEIVHRIYQEQKSLNYVTVTLIKEGE